MDTTPQEKCEQIIALYNSLSDNVRSEAHITSPKSCDENNLLEKINLQKIT